jgi:uncharacterized protein (TIGR03083 family)
VDPTAALDVLEREAARFAELLDGDLGAPVRGCPGWTLADLARHLGGVHRWAAAAVLVGETEEEAGPREAERIAPWFREGAEQLVALLRATDPGQPCWTFGEPPSAAFWRRRQAHETALHRWDAAASQGQATEVEEAVAQDGIAEVVSVFVPRQVRLGRLAPGPEVVELVSTAGTHTLVTTGPRPGPPTATVTGPAEALLLLLWHRTDLDDPRLHTTGAVGDARRLLGRPLTP